MFADASDQPTPAPATPVWVCPVCAEPIDQHDQIAVSRHHDWHRLIERQQRERHGRGPGSDV